MNRRSDFKKFGHFENLRSVAFRWFITNIKFPIWHFTPPPTALIYPILYKTHCCKISHLFNPVFLWNIWVYINLFSLFNFYDQIPSKEIIFRMKDLESHKIERCEKVWKSQFFNSLPLLLRNNRCSPNFFRFFIVLTH